jgi:hypothetical protein
MRDRHPELQARLVELEPDAAIPALGRGDVDVAIVQDWIDAPLSLPASPGAICSTTRSTSPCPSIIRFPAPNRSR